MNILLLIASILCFLLGLVHSFLGEVLIFKNKRKKGTFVPSKGSAELKERHLRILWATWHLASVFGCSIGVILIKIALTEDILSTDLVGFLTPLIGCTMLLSSTLVLLGTKGKHPGWVILLLIGILTLLGN